MSESVTPFHEVLRIQHEYEQHNPKKLRRTISALCHNRWTAVQHFLIPPPLLELTFVKLGMGVTGCAASIPNGSPFISICNNRNGTTNKPYSLSSHFAFYRRINCSPFLVLVLQHSQTGLP
jgi:hypothetical protein